MNRLFLPAILLPVIFSACTIYREYPIDIYKPGEVTIPPSAQDAAVVYRNFKYPGDTLLHFYKDDHRLIRSEKDPENLDSILVYTCLNELITNLKNNEIFQKVKIFPYNAFKRHTAKKLPDIPPELIQKIGSTAQADWLISLETFSCFFSKYTQTTESPGSNEVFTIAVWGVYDVAQNKRIERKTMVDTLFWNRYDEQGNYRGDQQLPPRSKALKIASAMAGEKYAKRFFSSWQTVDRVYSVPPLPDFSEAANYFEDGKYEQAIALWKKYVPEKNGKLSINACYNIALAYEMKDELNTAHNWLNASYKLALSYRSRQDMKLIQSYQKALNKRISDIEKLE